MTELDFTKPAPRVETLEEAQALIDQLWLLLGRQEARIKALEEKLNTNSRNSSKPPSADHGKKSSNKGTKSGKKAGAQPGHIGKGRELLEQDQVTHVRDCHPNKHCRCGGVVKICRLDWRHQVIDLPEIKPLVTEYRLYAGTCQRCGNQHNAELPPGVSRRLIGPRLLAWIGTLTGGYRLSKRLTQGLLQDMFQIDVSLGTISQSEAVLSAALESVVQEAHEHVKRSPVVHADETGHKEKGNRQWMWVAIAGMVSVFMARMSRSTEVAKELLGAGFAGTLIADRYAGYAWINVQKRQFCWAHLLRDFTKISERSGGASQIGEELIEYTKRMFRFWHCVRDGTLSRTAFECHMLFLKTKMEALLQRGCTCGESKTANTCRRLLLAKQSLWTFVDTPGIEPTNNLAERTLRSYVIWRKVSFGTQSKRGSLYMERMMTVVGSCKLQQRNILHFITRAVQAYSGNAATPSLVRAAA